MLAITHVCCLPATFYLLAIKRIPGATPVLPFCLLSDTSQASYPSRGAALPLLHVSQAVKPLRNDFQMLQATGARRSWGAGSLDMFSRVPPGPGAEAAPRTQLGRSRQWQFSCSGSCWSAALSSTHQHLPTPACPRCEVLWMLPPG